MDFLAALEHSAFGAWVRESNSLWAYPSILFLHTIGLGFLVGANVAVDLRILGFAPRLPVKPMEIFFPLMWMGFWVNAASGVALMIADATTMLRNPVFYVKFVSIALAVVNIWLLKHRVFQDPSLDKGPLPMNAKILAATSIAFWAVAITAGRLTAYIGPRPGVS